MSANTDHVPEREPEKTGHAISSQVELLHRMSGVISSDLTLEEMLEDLIGLVVEITNCDACMVYLPDHSTGEIVLRASQLPHSAEIGAIRMKKGEGITGWVAEHNSVVAISSHASEDRRFKRFPALVEDTYEAFLSVPLLSGGEVIGVINVHHREPRIHGPEEISLLTFLGQQMGVAIATFRLIEENTRLQEETQEMKRQLETRKLVERAKGILQEKHNLTEREAYQRLRDESRRLRRPMRDLAEAVMMAEDLAQKTARGASPAGALDDPDDAA
ncbi:MAG TPA: GAF domain-containing protein [Terriglobia bacterium]|nr:GAF domain-containing protein [Terriglobia bacterium]